MELEYKILWWVMLVYAIGSGIFYRIMIRRIKKERDYYEHELNELRRMHGIYLKKINRKDLNKWKRPHHL